MQLTLAVAAAVLASIPSAHASLAYIVNHCDFKVNVWSVSADETPAYPTAINANGGQYHENYQVPSIGGISMKLTTGDSVADPVTQFEYTLAGNIWYDISNINCVDTQEGCPFEAYGIHMVSGPGCPTVTCEPGVARCTSVYNAPDENSNSLCCGSDQDLTLHLCATSGNNLRRDTSESPALPAVQPRKSPLQHGHRSLGHPHWRH